jgi:hypothetical protein
MKIIVTTNNPVTICPEEESPCRLFIPLYCVVQKLSATIMGAFNLAIGAEVKPNLVP